MTDWRKINNYNHHRVNERLAHSLAPRLDPDAYCSAIQIQFDAACSEELV